MLSYDMPLSCCCILRHRQIQVVVLIVVLLRYEYALIAVSDVVIIYWVF